MASRLAVGCPLLSTLDKSKGKLFKALRGSGAAAGFIALPFGTGLVRPEGVLLFVPLAGEARMVELEAVVAVGTCTMMAVYGVVFGLCEDFRRSNFYDIDIEEVCLERGGRARPIMLVTPSCFPLAMDLPYLPLPTTKTRCAISNQLVHSTVFADVFIPIVPTVGEGISNKWWWLSEYVSEGGRMLKSFDI